MKKPKRKKSDFPPDLFADISEKEFAKLYGKVIDEFCEMYGEVEAVQRIRGIIAAVNYETEMADAQQRQLSKAKPFDWRTFKATDYVPRETNDEPKRSRTSLKAR